MTRHWISSKTSLDNAVSGQMLPWIGSALVDVIKSHHSSFRGDLVDFRGIYFYYIASHLSASPYNNQGVYL